MIKLFYLLKKKDISLAAGNKPISDTFLRPI